MSVSTPSRNSRLRWLNLARVSCGVFAASCLAVSALGEARFHTHLDTNLKLTNDFDRSVGFLGALPKPEAPGEENPRTGTQKKTGKTKQSHLTEAWGKTFRLNSPHKTVYNAHFMRLRVAGNTWADGELAEWASGRQRITLHNKTGDADGRFGAAREVDFDLHLEANAWLTAIASPDADIDRATSKVLFKVWDVASGAELEIDGQGVVQPLKEALKMPADVVDSHQIANEGETKNEQARSTSYFTVPVPANTKKQLDIEAYVYGSAISRLPPKEDEIEEERKEREEALEAFLRRSNEEYPDPDMKIELADDLLPGDVGDQGSWRTDSAAGVLAADPLAHHGLDTVFLSHAALSPDGPHDVQLTLEVPVDGVKQFAIENSMFTPGGRTGHDYRLSIGVGAGEEFEEAEDTELLSIFGHGSELPPVTLDDLDLPQPRDYWLTIDGSDDPLVTSLLGGFELSPGDETTGLFVVQLADAADGVIDGLASFTLRQTMDGIAGDYNDDGLIDVRDYWSYRDAFGSDVEGLIAMVDGNANGFADPGDYTIWRDALSLAGVTLGVDPGRDDLPRSVASVPAPSGVALVAALALLPSARRRR